MLRLVRPFLFVIILIVTMVSMGCSSSDRAKTLNVFNYTEYIPDSVIKQFEQKFDIKVNYQYFSSHDEMVAKLSIDPSAYDVVFGSDHGIQPMIERGLVQKINLTNIPNFKYIDEYFRNQDFDPNNEYSIAFMGVAVPIGVNTDLISTDISSYADLWKPELKNKIVLTEDPRFVIGMVLKTLGYSANDTDPIHLEEAKQKLIELLPNVRLFDSDNPKSLLLSNEVGIALTWGAELAIAQEEMPNLTTIIPTEGLIVAADNMLIPTGAKHKDNAEVFINFILDPKISAEISSAFPYINPNLEARKQIDPRILANIAVYPPTDSMNNSESLAFIGDTNQVIDRIWTEIKSKR